MRHVRRHPELLFLVGLDCLRLEFLKFVNRRSLVYLFRTVPILCQKETETIDLIEKTGTNRKDLLQRKLRILGKPNAITSIDVR